MTPEQQALFDNLTQLQQRVATNVLSGMSQRIAYFQAGGSAKTDLSADATASELLSNPNVKSFMDSMKRQAVNDAIMGREEMMARLSTLSRYGVKDIVKFETAEVGRDMESGKPVHQTAWHIPDDVPEDRLSIIESLEGGKGAPKIKTYSSIQAMALLAKLQGFEAAQKFEHSGPGGGPILTKDVSELSDDQLMALIAGAPAKDE